jgi:hypothetical protein
MTTHLLDTNCAGWAFTTVHAARSGQEINRQIVGRQGSLSMPKNLHCVGALQGGCEFDTLVRTKTHRLFDKAIAMGNPQSEISLPTIELQA